MGNHLIASGKHQTLHLYRLQSKDLMAAIHTVHLALYLERLHHIQHSWLLSKQKSQGLFSIHDKNRLHIILSGYVSTY